MHEALIEVYSALIEDLLRSVVGRMRDALHLGREFRRGVLWLFTHVVFLRQTGCENLWDVIRNLVFVQRLLTASFHQLMLVELVQLFFPRLGH